MSDDFGKELLMLGGTIAGFIAALLTVMEKLLDIQHRIQARKEPKGSPQTERTTVETALSIPRLRSVGLKPAAT